MNDDVCAALGAINEIVHDVSEGLSTIRTTVNGSEIPEGIKTELLTQLDDLCLILLGRKVNEAP